LKGHRRHKPGLECAVTDERVVKLCF